MKRIFSKDGNYTEHHPVFYSMMYHFFACLRTFHLLTLHLKTKEYTKHYPRSCFYSCPFGRGAQIWRNHYNLKYLTGSTLNITCQCNKPQQFAATKSHLNREQSNFDLHQGVSIYLSECTKKLPPHS